MSSASSNESAGLPACVLEFTQWPIGDEPWRAGSVLAALVACGLVGVWTCQQLWLATLVCPLLALTAWRLWLPVRYEFGPRGISESLFRWKRLIRWREIGDLEFRRRGVVLYPFADRSAIGSLRTLFIRFPPAMAERLRASCEEYWNRTGGKPSPSGDSSSTGHSITGVT